MTMNRWNQGCGQGWSYPGPAAAGREEPRPHR